MHSRTSLTLFRGRPPGNATTRTTKGRAVAALAALILLSTGCGSAAPGAAAPPSAGPSSPAASSPAASPKASKSPPQQSAAAAPTAPQADGLPLAVRGPVATAKGTYLQISIAEDDPVWNPDPALMDSRLLSVYSTAEVEAAYRNNLAFVVEEVLDSPLNGGAVAPDAWWAENEDRFAPELHSTARRSLDTEPITGVVMLNNLTQAKYGEAYQYIYEPDRPRFTRLDIQPTGIWLATDNKSIFLELSVSADMEIAAGAGEPGTDTQTISGTTAFACLPGAEPGQWLISGWENQLAVTVG